MQGRDAQELTPEELLGKDLRDIGEYGDDEESSDKRQDGDADAAAQVVGHEGDRADGEREPHGTRIAHIESRWRNVKPQKCEQPAHHAGGKRREVYLGLRKCDDGIRREYRGEHPARKPVDAVNDARGVERERYDDKERNDKPSNLERRTVRDVDGGDVELVEEPPPDESSERDDDENTVAQPQALRVLADDQNIVHK